jgi:transposase
MGGSNFSSTHSFLRKWKAMSAIVTIGIDLAKNVFAVHGVDATGKLALVRPCVPLAKLSRAQMSEPALSANSGRWSNGNAGAQRFSSAAHFSATAGAIF